MADSVAEYKIKGVFDNYPYGKIMRQFMGGDGEKFLSTTNERDIETGLDHRWKRFSDSEIGRFLSRDPMSDLFSSWSPYNYVYSNPIKFTDPNGDCIPCKELFKTGVLAPFSYGASVIKRENVSVTTKNVYENYQHNSLLVNEYTSHLFETPNINYIESVSERTSTTSINFSGTEAIINTIEITTTIFTGTPGAKNGSTIQTINSNSYRYDLFSGFISTMIGDLSAKGSSSIKRQVNQNYASDKLKESYLNAVEVNKKIDADASESYNVTEQSVKTIMQDVEDTKSMEKITPQ
ncbi:MAG TPA: RHS repeat-associated core domain-containing protein [Bacteroidia bacterium]|nr:RHS repeat-associated core domain-containing protein [Bacteroidia bacterium]